VYTINFIYAMLIFGLIYFSINLTNRNQKFVRFVYGVSTILGVMSLIMLVILTVDLVRGLGRGSSYLIHNQSPTFTDQIPGGQSTVDLIRYVVLGIMGLYGLPLLLYSICFCNIRVIFEVIAGSLSFAFYTPTYLIILSIYALCRMDDLSWGTKGLDAGSDKDNSVLEVWKIIKTIHVAKLLFWNVVVAGLLIHFGSNYLIRFYLTFVLMIIIASTMLFKVICGILYYFYYLITIRNKKEIRTSQIE
jgi:chitin synthase